MKTLIAITLIALAACAHRGPVDKNHEASGAVERARGATNTGNDPLVPNSDVQRVRNSTNNAPN